MISRPKVAFIADVSLRTPHFGCQLVGQTIREQLARAGLDLVATLPAKYEGVSGWENILNEVDLVVINGEGSIHHGRFQNMIDLAGNWPSALINCVYQENPPNSNLKCFKYISARESMSVVAIREHGAVAEVVPDVLFASSFLRSFIPIQPLRRDNGFTDCAVKVERRVGPFKLRYRPGFSPKQKVVGDYLNFLSSHRRIAVGRFHAAICCSVMGIPFSTWDSNTWKTEGLMRDMGVSELHFASRDLALANVPLTFSPEIADFAEKARWRIEAMFDRLREVV